MGSQVGHRRFVVCFSKMRAPEGELPPLGIYRCIEVVVDAPDAGAAEQEAKRTLADTSLWEEGEITIRVEPALVWMHAAQCIGR